MSINPNQLKETHYTTSEAAKLLQIEPETVRRYCGLKRIKAVRLFGESGPWCVPQSSIDKYIASESDFGRPKASRQNGHKRRK